MRRWLLAVIVAVGCLLVPAATNALPYDPVGAVPWYATPAPVGPDPQCLEDYNDSPPTNAGPAITWGIGPQLSGDAGIGQSAAVPENPAKRDAALRELAPPGAPFVVRLNRLFESDGTAGIAAFKALANQYAALGLDVLVQVRYHPTAAENGNMAAWVAYVRQVVDAFGPDSHVTALQITNEVNLPLSPNTSDGAYDDAVQAVIQGVIAAKQESVARGFSQLRIGFNYAATNPTADVAFFRELGQQGGAEFRRSVDWVGADMYPGTFFPPAFVDAGDVLIEQLASLRRCLMPAGGFGQSVPIFLTELGYPTGAGRSDGSQVSALEGFVDALNAYRGVYGVANVDWFDLRDNDSASPSFQEQYGLLTDDYAPKPAFYVYQRLVRELSASGTAPPGRSASPGRLGVSVRPRRATTGCHVFLVRVFRRPSGHGVRGARVTIGRHAARTRAGGDARLLACLRTAGRHRVTVTRRGFSRAWAVIEVRRRRR